MVERPCANQHEIGDTFVVGLWCDVRMREQRFDLGPERQQAGGVEIVEGPHADRIAYEQQSLRP